MKQLQCDVLVIGAGPAGLAAAYEARRTGAANVVIVERNDEAGGILPQCIHNGFGVRALGADLTGPEYAYRWIDRARKEGVGILSRTMVLGLEAQRAVVANPREGLVDIMPRAVVLCMGCRERPRGALAIPGERPAGVYTAGTAQRLVNMEGYMPGSRYVILGSGDIGMIMARRLTLEGAEVAEMAEILPYVSGLRRNLVQCIRDFDIPLSLCTTVTNVYGRDRVEAVELSTVDERWRPVPGSQRRVPCDTLLLSVGLIPENELSRVAGVAIDPVTGGPFVDERFATSVPGIFAAGNVVHVYDLVDDVTESALAAGRSAARHAMGLDGGPRSEIELAAGDNVRHVVPHRLDPGSLEQGEVLLHLRVRRPIEAATRIEVWADDHRLLSRRLRYVRPAEMVTIALQEQHRAMLEGARRLTIHAQEA
ncbi:MAG: FAD-dependent oxidoreductase [Chloroflexi bacterium]|nr:FAD-dependent oxidoreductase [Chloroflexota bacterium]